VADIRNAVRASVTDLAPGALVLAACSGGADSLALAAALAFVGRAMACGPVASPWITGCRRDPPTGRPPSWQR